jgi:hypothetical protein
MKTNLLLLDNKIRKDEAGNNTTVVGENPAPVEKPEASMKALMFKGLQNLMSNPALAEELGISTPAVNTDREAAQAYVAPFSSNLAFKGGKTKALTAATAAILGGMSMTSCIKVPESEPTNVTQIAIQIQDNEAVVAAIMVLSQQIDELREQLANQEKAQAERDRQMIEAMNVGLTIMNNIHNELQGFREDEKMSAEQLRLLLMSNNAAILDAIAVINNTSKENAQNIIDTIINAYKDGKITFTEAIAQIQDLFGTLINRLDQNFERLFANHDETVTYLDALLSEAKKVDVKMTVLIKKANTIIQNQAVEKELVIEIAKDLKTLNGNITYTREALIKALEVLGYTFAQYSTWNTDRMIEVIQNSVTAQNQVIMANGQKIDGLSIQLQQIINDFNNQIITEQQAIDLLKSIDQGVQDLNGKADALYDLIASFKSDLNALIRSAQNIEANTGVTAAETKAISNKIKTLENRLTSLVAIAIEVRDKLNSGASFDDSDIIAAINALGLDMNAGKNEIVAKLNQYIPELQNIEAAINKLDKNNQNKLDMIANLMKSITVDNKDVVDAIVDLKNSNEETLANKTNLLADKLDKLIAKVETVIGKLDNAVSVINQYGQQLNEKFNLNNSLLEQAVKGINLSNANEAELKAELERIAGLLKQVNGNIVIGDNYLEEISKKQLPALEEAINNISAIGGGGLTKQELQETLNAFGDNLWNTYGGYFVQAGKDDARIIQLLEEANALRIKINNNIINAAADANKNSEELKGIVTAIRDYLPELKHECHLECNCPTIEQLEQLIIKYKKVDEAIIGNLN